MNTATRFLVVGTHRKDGGLYVWCGVTGGGFRPIQKIEENGLAGQLVNASTADELVRRIRDSSSDYKFEISIVPCNDLIGGERPSLIVPH